MLKASSPYNYVRVILGQVILPFAADSYRVAKGETRGGKQLTKNNSQQLTINGGIRGGGTSALTFQVHLQLHKRDILKPFLAALALAPQPIDEADKRANDCPQKCIVDHNLLTAMIISPAPAVTPAP
jgi:hypothetical protein